MTTTVQERLDSIRTAVGVACQGYIGQPCSPEKRTELARTIVDELFDDRTPYDLIEARPATWEDLYPLLGHRLFFQALDAAGVHVYKPHRDMLWVTVDITVPVEYVTIDFVV